MKKYHIIGSLSVVLTILSVLVFTFWLIPHQADITKFTIAHPVLAPLILILWRFIGVVIPPIPGGLLSFALIPVLGWFWAYVYSTIGLLLGAIVAFLLARKYREPLVKRFVPLQDLQHWEKKLGGSKELWGFIVFRMATEPVMDFISYLAGLSTIGFRKFFIATLISLLPSAFAYYIGGALYKRFAGENPYVGIWIFVVLGVLYLIYQQRRKSKQAKQKKKP